MRIHLRKVALRDRPRSSYLDALKGAAILLVVFGHIIETSTDAAYVSLIYNSIYVFHMPLFAFMAGMTSRERVDAASCARIIRSVLIPFILFQIAYQTAAYLAYGKQTYPPLSPYWIMWFLASLAIWKLALPLFRSNLGLLTSVALAAISGYYLEIAFALNLSRTVYFFPFFLIGSLYGKAMLGQIRRHRNVAWLGLALSTVAIIIWTRYGLHEWNLVGAFPYFYYAALPHYPATGRLLLMLGAIFGMMGFCALVPKSCAPLEYLGQRVISVYLLHGFVIILYRTIGQPFHQMDGLVFIAIPASIAIAYTAALVHRPLQTLFEVIFGAGAAFNRLTKSPTHTSD